MALIAAFTVAHNCTVLYRCILRCVASLQLKRRRRDVGVALLLLPMDAGIVAATALLNRRLSDLHCWLNKSKNTKLNVKNKHSSWFIYLPRAGGYKDSFASSSK